VAAVPRVSISKNPDRETKKQQKHISHRPTDLELASKPIGARACEQGCPSASSKSENVAGTS